MYKTNNIVAAEYLSATFTSNLQQLFLFLNAITGERGKHTALSGFKKRRDWPGNKPRDNVIY
jgi:hypothetical protein